MNTILEQDIELFAQQFALKDELRKKTIAITGATGLLMYGSLPIKIK